MTDRPRVYVDTNIFIYALKVDDDNSAAIQDLFQMLRDNIGMAITSELTLAEVLAPQGKKREPLTPQLRRLYLNLIVFGRIFELHPISRDILYETVDLRKTQKLKLPDAIHLVTAIQSGCKYFVSNDNDFRMPNEMVQIKLADLPVAEFSSIKS